MKKNTNNIIQISNLKDMLNNEIKSDNIESFKKEYYKYLDKYLDKFRARIDSKVFAKEFI